MLQTKVINILYRHNFPTSLNAVSAHWMKKRRKIESTALNVFAIILRLFRAIFYGFG